MALLRRSLKIVAVVLGVLVGLLAVAAASAFAYGHAESNRTTSLPYLLAFFDRYLKGEKEPLLLGPSDPRSLTCSEGRVAI